MACNYFDRWMRGRDAFIRLLKLQSLSQHQLRPSPNPNQIQFLLPCLCIHKRPLIELPPAKGGRLVLLCSDSHHPYAYLQAYSTLCLAVKHQATFLLGIRRTWPSISVRKRLDQKGGRARAEKLTSEQRSEIAKKAAEARWDEPDLAQAVCGAPDRPLKIGEREIQAYVLEGRNSCTNSSRFS